MDLITKIPNEMKLCIILYLDNKDIENFMKTFNINLTKPDFIFLLNSIKPEFTNEILNVRTNNISYNDRYMLFRYINIEYYLDEFIEEYISIVNIFTKYPKLFYNICDEILILTQENQNIVVHPNSWGYLYNSINKDGLCEEPFIYFSESFDMYKLLDILSNYNQLIEGVSGGYREMMSQVDELNSHNIKYLKYTYNKFGDQGYILFFLVMKVKEVFRWFLGLETDTGYPNIRGPINIIDVDEMIEYITEANEKPDDIYEYLIEIFNDYINKYQKDNNYTKDIHEASKFLEWLQSQDDEKSENE